MRSNRPSRLEDRDPLAEGVSDKLQAIVPCYRAVCAPAVTALDPLQRQEIERVEGWL